MNNPIGIGILNIKVSKSRPTPTITYNNNSGKGITHSEYMQTVKESIASQYGIWCQ